MCNIRSWSSGLLSWWPAAHLVFSTSTASQFGTFGVQYYEYSECRIQDASSSGCKQFFLVSLYLLITCSTSECLPTPTNHGHISKLTTCHTIGWNQSLMEENTTNPPKWRGVLQHLPQLSLHMLLSLMNFTDAICLETDKEELSTWAPTFLRFFGFTVSPPGSCRVYQSLSKTNIYWQAQIFNLEPKKKFCKIFITLCAVVVCLDVFFF